MPACPDPYSAALDAAIGDFGAMIRRVGWQYRLADSDVDELLQDVRVRLWRARPDSEHVRTVSASYVYRTAVSAALDLLRRRRVGRTESFDLREHDRIATDSRAAIGPEEELAESELAEQIVQVVEEIAPARRPVVRMHLAGYRREEIAELLGWTEAKTRNLLYRGLADVREGLLERGIGWSGPTNTPAQDRTATT